MLTGRGEGFDIPQNPPFLKWNELGPSAYWILAKLPWLCLAQCAIVAYTVPRYGGQTRVLGDTAGGDEAHHIVVVVVVEDPQRRKRTIFASYGHVLTGEGLSLG